MPEQEKPVKIEKGYPPPEPPAPPEKYTVKEGYPPPSNPVTPPDEDSEQ